MSKLAENVRAFLILLAFVLALSVIVALIGNVGTVELGIIFVLAFGATMVIERRLRRKRKMSSQGR